jgi:hypothetical protein
MLFSKVLAKSQYSFNNFNFDVYFGFDPNKRLLHSVVLILKKGIRTCEDMMTEARATYGVPETTDKGTVLTILAWRSESSGNLVNFRAIGGDWCMLNYTPLPKPAEGGL